MLRSTHVTSMQPTIDPCDLQPTTSSRCSADTVGWKSHGLIEKSFIKWAKSKDLWTLREMKTSDNPKREKTDCIWLFKVTAVVERIGTTLIKRENINHNQMRLAVKLKTNRNQLCPGREGPFKIGTGRSRLLTVCSAQCNSLPFLTRLD